MRLQFWIRANNKKNERVYEQVIEVDAFGNSMTSATQNGYERVLDKMSNQILFPSDVNEVTISLLGK